MPKVKIRPKHHYSSKRKDNEVIEVDGPAQSSKESPVVAMVDLCDKEKLNHSGASCGLYSVAM